MNNNYTPPFIQTDSDSTVQEPAQQQEGQPSNTQPNIYDNNLRTRFY